MLFDFSQLKVKIGIYEQFSFFPSSPHSDSHYENQMTFDSTKRDHVSKIQLIAIHHFFTKVGTPTYFRLHLILSDISLFVRRITQYWESRSL